MSRESLRVLELVAEGKITPEEGERLIKALETKGTNNKGQFTLDIPEIKIPKIDMGQFGEICVELKNTLVEGAKKAQGQLRKGKAKRYFDFKDYPVTVELPQGISRAHVNLELRAGKMKLKGYASEDNILEGKVKRVPDPPILLSDVRDGQAEITLKHSLGRCGLRLNDKLKYKMALDNAAADSSLDLSELTVDLIELDNNAGNVYLKLGGQSDRAEIGIKNNAGNVRLFVPETHAVRITTSGSLSSNNLERLGLEVVEGVAVSKDWNDNSKGVDIVLKQNVASFHLDWKRRGGSSVGDDEPAPEPEMPSADLDE